MAEDMENSCCCPAEVTNRTTKRSEKLRTDLLSRLSRIEGQVRGIKGMVEKDSYCDDVLNQVAAAQAALNSVAKILLESHIRGCVVRKIKNGDEEVIDELIHTIGKLL